MDRSRATFEAFDGVELRLLNGRVVHCPTLTVAEAVRYLRLMSTVAEDFSAHYTFMSEFPERVGIAEVPLADLGLALGSPLPDGGEVGGDLTLAEALALLKLLSEAEQRDGAGAQSDFLDRFPAALKLDPQMMTPAEVFEFGRTFAQAVYTVVYGMAEDFLTHQTASPRGPVMTMVRATTLAKILSPQVSTT